MKFIIEDEQFTYMVDWSKKDKLEDGILTEYYPSAAESIDSFLMLLHNIYSPNVISDALADGLDALDYSERGKKARRMLESIDEDN